VSDEDGWVPVEGFPGYSVNPLGLVKRDSSGHVLRPRVNQYGVVYVGLMKEGYRHQRVRSLALLVARAFIPQPNPVWDTPINLDGNRFNCRVDNLMWRPRWYAERYNNQFTTERYEHPIHATIVDYDTDDEFPNSMVAACENGLLEREVVLSILNNTVAWPTNQRFVVAD
jgi:hypothetical protein